jgi:hypothetical protein
MGRPCRPFPFRSDMSESIPKPCPFPLFLFRFAPDGDRLRPHNLWFFFPLSSAQDPVLSATVAPVTITIRTGV